MARRAIPIIAFPRGLMYIYIIIYILGVGDTIPNYSNSQYYTSDTGYRYQIQASSIETTPPNDVIFDSHAPFNI